MNTGEKETVNRQNLILLAMAKFTSGFASYIYDIGIVIYLFDQTGSVAVIGGFFIAQLFPAFLILLAGSIIDRYNKKSLMVWSHMIKAASFILLLIDRSIISIYLVTFIMNLLLEFEGSTLNALMTNIFPKKHLLKAASVTNLLDSFSMVAAPVSASLIAMHFQIQMNLTIDIILFVVSAVIYMLLRLTNNLDAPAEKTAGRKIGYLSMMKNNKLLKTIISWNIFMLCIGITTPMEISMIEETLQMPSSYYGIGNTIEGIGMLAASGLILWRVRKLCPETIITIGLFSAAFSYLVIGISGNIFVYYAGACLVGMTACLCPLGFKTDIQMKCGQTVIGRVFTTTRFTVLLSRIAGSLIVGEVLKIWNIRIIYYCVAIILITAALWAQLYRRRQNT